MAKSAQIAKMSSRHEAILNHIIANPTQTYGEVAATFSVTPSWLSVVVNSQAFRNQLKRRHDELFDSAIAAPIGEKLEAAVDLTLEKYLEKIPSMTTDQVINASDKMLNKLGYGSKNTQTVVNGNVVQNVQHNHVSSDIIEKAREKIGQIKMGQSDHQAALLDQTSDEGTEVERTEIREEG